MTVAPNPSFRVDNYVVDTLMRDLVGHDHSPAAFVVYLLLWRRTRGAGAKLESVRLSHRAIAEEVGLSKSAVQHALRILHRRGFVKSKQRYATDTPEHHVTRPWATNAR